MIEKSKIIEAYHFRHACKVFDKKKKINEEDFTAILETGRLSPSSFGFEPWKFLIVQNMELREKLKQFTWGAQGTLPTASHFVVILARKQKSMQFDADYITHMMVDVHHLPKESAEHRRSIYKVFQESDFKLLESERSTFDWAAKQTYIALGNMMTTAAMIGIDSCPIEGFKAAEIELLMAEEFGIDIDEFGVAVMVAFGYRIEKQKPKTRQSIDVVTSWYN
jgi:nitroreductase